MSRLSRSLRRFQSSLRCRTGWEDGPGVALADASLTSFTSSASAIVGLGQASGDQDGQTIARVRGLLEVFLTASTAAGDGYFGAVAIGIVSAPAFAAGVASVPTPLTEIEWEGWLWFSYFGVHAPGAGTASSSEVRQRVVIDSRAMRKVGSAEVVYVAAEVVEAGTATMLMRVATRMLVMAP